MKFEETLEGKVLEPMLAYFLEEFAGWVDLYVSSRFDPVTAEAQRAALTEDAQQYVACRKATEIEKWEGWERWEAGEGEPEPERPPT